MNESAHSFYLNHGLHVEIYDDMTQFGKLLLDEAFYREIALQTGGPILELGCGTGRLVLPLLDTGLEIHGLDLNQPMLDIAARKRAQLPVEAANRLHLHHGDMEDFGIDREFALIYIAFRSFQILVTPEAQRRCLECIRRHLAPNGRVIINLFDPNYSMMQPGRQERTVAPRELVHPISGNRVVVETLERVVDPITQTFVERWRFTESDTSGAVLRQEEERLHLRWTFRYEMQHLARLCGFEVEAEYSDFHRSPPVYGKEQVWVLRVV